MSALDGSLAELHGLLGDDVAKRFGLPSGNGRLTRSQWKRIEHALQQWSEKLVRSGRLYPARSYRRGMHQVMQFLHLLHDGQPGEFTPRAERSQIEWLNRYAENELVGAMSQWSDEIRSAVLNGLHHEVNPTQTASWLYKVTRDAREDWRRIARTETARANALGRYAGCEQAGYDRVWIPPHAGSCEDCRRLIENRIFTIAELREASNFKRKKADWQAALPTHPNCRHVALPYVESVYGEAQREYGRMRDMGLDDETLDRMFDSGGQLRPQYESDPRIAELFATKTGDPFMLLLGDVVRKQAKVSVTVSKGFFDAPQRGLDPLLWDGEMLRPAARSVILDFWTGVLGAGWQDWATVYITGSATSYQRETGYPHPWVGPNQTPMAPDVDTHLAIDYDKLRAQRALWAAMTPVEIRGMLEAWVDRAKQKAEIMPGLRLDAFVRLEATPDEFARDIRQTGQAVYDVNADAWIVPPSATETGETYGVEPLAGYGGHLASEHPDWLAAAEDAGRELQCLFDVYQAAASVENLRALQACMDGLYVARSEGFSGGEGQRSRGNFIWQWLERYGVLAEAKMLLKAALDSSVR